MRVSLSRDFSPVSLLLLAFAGMLCLSASAQAPAKQQSHRAPALPASAGNSGTVSGVVTDPSGAIVPGASVTLANPVSGFTRTTTTDNSGTYAIANIPFNTYKLNVNAPTLAPTSQTVDVQSFVPLTKNVTLQIAGASTTVDVTASSGDLIETDPVQHRPRPVLQDPALGNIFGELPGHPRISRRFGRFERAVSRHGRPRFELLLRGWAAYHRPAVQSLF
jgi:hypothetical protein